MLAVLGTITIPSTRSVGLSRDLAMVSARDRLRRTRPPPRQAPLPSEMTVASSAVARSAIIGNLAEGSPALRQISTASFGRTQLVSSTTRLDLSPSLVQAK